MMKKVLLLIVTVCVLTGSVPVAKAGICPSLTQAQKHTIKVRMQKAYPHATIALIVLLTQHGENGRLLINVYDPWPQLKRHWSVPIRNKCSTPLTNSGIPSWWPTGLPYYP